MRFLRIGIFALVVLLTLGRSAAAEQPAAEQPAVRLDCHLGSDPEMPAADAEAVRSAVCAEVAKHGGPRGRSYRIWISLDRMFGTGRTIVSLLKHSASEGDGWASLGLRSMADLPFLAPQLADAVFRAQTTGPTRLRAGIGVLLVSPSFSTVVDSRATFDLPGVSLPFSAEDDEFGVLADLRFAHLHDATWFALSFGVSIFPIRGALTPYLQAGLSASYYGLRTADVSSFGVQGGIWSEVGVTILHRHPGQLSLGARFDVGCTPVHDQLGQEVHVFAAVFGLTSTFDLISTFDPRH